MVRTCVKCQVTKPVNEFRIIIAPNGAMRTRLDCRVCENAGRRDRASRPLAELPDPEFDIDIDEPQITRSYTSPAIEKILIVPDTHAPYHDRIAVNVLVEAAKVFQPDGIVCLGDFFDFYAVSSHRKDPRRIRDIKDEVEAGREVLKRIGATTQGWKRFVAGNHEDRLSRYIMDRAPELFGTIKVPEMLGLQELGWSYTPYGDHIQLGRVYFTHDVETAGRYAHYKALEAFQDNVVTGHTHRLGWAVEGNAKNKPHVTAHLGWLGDFSTIDYKHRIKCQKDWAHGFGIAYHETATGNVHVQPIAIVNGTACVEGRIVRG